MNSIVPKRDIPESVHSSYDEDLDLIRSTLRSLLLSGEEGLRLANESFKEFEYPLGKFCHNHFQSPFHLHHAASSVILLWILQIHFE